MLINSIMNFVIGVSVGLGLSAIYKKIKKRNQELNDDILELIKERMDKGRKHYGHGLLRGDRDWNREALEEALDLSIYLSAKLVE